MVILKSPVIGFSAVSRVRCANEIAVTAETAKIMRANRGSLLFISDSLIDSYRLGEPSAKLSKSPGLLKPLVVGTRVTFFPTYQKRDQILLHHLARSFELS